MASAPYIIVAGGMASGKTTLARVLADRFRLPVFLERPERNPFVADFYEDPTRWALASQLWFTADTLAYQAEACSGGIQDHSSYEAVHVYASALREIGYLQPREYDLLIRVLDVGVYSLRAPDVVVLLDADVDTVLKRISLRKRPYEQRISPTYVEALIKAREKYFASWALSPLVRVDAARLDGRRETDLAEIVHLLKQAINVSAGLDASLRCYTG